MENFIVKQKNIINKMTELSKSEVLTDENFIIAKSEDIKSINKKALEYNGIDISANNIFNNKKFFNSYLEHCVQNNKMILNKEFCKKFAVDIGLIADNSKEEKNKIYNKLFSTLNKSLGDESNKKEYFFYHLESDNKKYLGIKKKDKDRCFKNEITGLYNLLLDSNNMVADQKKPFLKQFNSQFFAKLAFSDRENYTITSNRNIL
ncbi:MAG: hypothetical protein LW595_02390 [Rickettsiales bacterium]|jgi:hypothetical protein|nr:hypothetical protein [Rickettsiales bacterium]